MRVPDKVIVLGEDFREEISVLKAVSYVGEKKVQQIMEAGKTTCVKLDCDYVIKFVFK